MIVEKSVMGRDDGEVPRSKVDVNGQCGDRENRGRGTAFGIFSDSCHGRR